MNTHIYSHTQKLPPPPPQISTIFLIDHNYMLLCTCYFYRGGGGVAPFKMDSNLVLLECKATVITVTPLGITVIQLYSICIFINIEILKLDVL